MKIIITGSNGQLGNEMRVLATKNNQHNFIFTDVAELDITDENAVSEFLKSQQADFLVNCAAYTDVNKAESDTEKARLINAIAPSILAKNCQKYNTKFIHISTDYVFDGKTYTPYQEIDKTSPESAYGLTKLDGEHAIISVSENYVIIRTAWLYSSFGKNFVKTMATLGKSKQEINVVFDQIGTPTYAADLASAIMEIINKTEQNPENFKSGIYHFSNEGVCSWYDFTIAIMQQFNLNCKINPIHTSEYPTQAKRPAYSVLDKTKIKTEYGISIPHWYESLKKCVQLLKEEK